MSSWGDSGGAKCFSMEQDKETSRAEVDHEVHNGWHGEWMIRSVVEFQYIVVHSLLCHDMPQI